MGDIMKIEWDNDKALQLFIIIVALASVFTIYMAGAEW